MSELSPETPCRAIKLDRYRSGEYVHGPQNQTAYPYFYPPSHVRKLDTSRHAWRTTPTPPPRSTYYGQHHGPGPPSQESYLNKHHPRTRRPRNITMKRVQRQRPLLGKRKGMHNS